MKHYCYHLTFILWYYTVSTNSTGTGTGNMGNETNTTNRPNVLYTPREDGEVCFNSVVHGTVRIPEYIRMPNIRIGCGVADSQALNNLDLNLVIPESPLAMSNDEVSIRNDMKSIKDYHCAIFTSTSELNTADRRRRLHRALHQDPTVEDVIQDNACNEAPEVGNTQMKAAERREALVKTNKYIACSIAGLSMQTEKIASIQQDLTRQQGSIAADIVKVSGLFGKLKDRVRNLKTGILNASEAVGAEFKRMRSSIQEGQESFILSTNYLQSFAKSLYGQIELEDYMQEREYFITRQRSLIELGLRGRARRIKQLRMLQRFSSLDPTCNANLDVPDTIVSTSSKIVVNLLADIVERRVGDTYGYYEPVGSVCLKTTITRWSDVVFEAVEGDPIEEYLIADSDFRCFHMTYYEHPLLLLAHNITVQGELTSTTSITRDTLRDRLWDLRSVSSTTVRRGGTSSSRSFVKTRSKAYQYAVSSLAALQNLAGVLSTNIATTNVFYNKFNGSVLTLLYACLIEHGTMSVGGSRTPLSPSAIRGSGPIFVMDPSFTFQDEDGPYSPLLGYNSSNVFNTLDVGEHKSPGDVILHVLNNMENQGVIRLEKVDFEHLPGTKADRYNSISVATWSAFLLRNWTVQSGPIKDVEFEDFKEIRKNIFDKRTRNTNRTFTGPTLSGDTKEWWSTSRTIPLACLGGFTAAVEAHNEDGFVYALLPPPTNRTVDTTSTNDIAEPQQNDRCMAQFSTSIHDFLVGSSRVGWDHQLHDNLTHYSWWAFNGSHYNTVARDRSSVIPGVTRIIYCTVEEADKYISLNTRNDDGLDKTRLLRQEFTTTRWSRANEFLLLDVIDSTMENMVSTGIHNYSIFEVSDSLLEIRDNLNRSQTDLRDRVTSLISEVEVSLNNTYQQLDEIDNEYEELVFWSNKTDVYINHARTIIETVRESEKYYSGGNRPPLKCKYFRDLEVLDIFMFPVIIHTLACRLTLLVQMIIKVLTTGFFVYILAKILSVMCKCDIGCCCRCGKGLDGVLACFPIIVFFIIIYFSVDIMQ